MAEGGQIVACRARRGPGAPSRGTAYPEIPPLNPCELETDLFCQGMCVDPPCRLAVGRHRLPR